MDIQTFTAPEGFLVRSVIKDGAPWFVAADVCRALEIVDGRQAVDRLDEDERGGCSVPTPGGVQQVRAVSESGLYSLVLLSRKPEAKKFKRWVTHDVLPAIRRTGAYSITPQPFALPASFAEALQLAADQARQIESQAKALEKAAPAVAFVDRYVEAKTTQPIRAVAKILGIKERDFVSYLEEEGIMYRLSGRLTPSAHHMELGRFEVKTGEANGHAFAQPRFTPAGIEWIARKVSEIQSRAIAA